MRRIATVLALLLTASAVQAGVEDEKNTREALATLLGCCGIIFFGSLMFFGTLLAVRRWWNRRIDRRDGRNPWT